VRSGGDVDASDWTVAVEHRVQENDRNGQRGMAMGADATRGDRALIEKEHATVVILAVLDLRGFRDFRTGGPVSSPMLVHEGGRVFMSRVIDGEMDMNRRQQHSADKRP
jgi:hypothetical protein